MSRTRFGGLNINPGTEIGSAGEATVFLVRGHADLAFKKYHSPTAERAQKLEVMVASPPVDPTVALLGHRSIAWPVDLVDRGPGLFEGFIMPRIEGAVSLAAVAHPRDRIRLGWKWTWRHLLRVAQNLSGAVAALHAAGYVIGDINTQNLLITEDALVTVIDCDSMQIPGPQGEVHRCPVGTPDFIAPELGDQLRRKRFDEFDRTNDSDNFALAILIYMLLFEGTHPYAGQWNVNGDPPERAKRMRGGLFAHGGDRRIAPPAGGPPFDVCPPELQKLFQVAFVDGAIRPELRPAAHAWRDALSAADQQLAVCASNPNHVYANHRTRCPWCERIKTIGVQDPFPHRTAHVPTQVRLPPHATQAPALPALIDVLQLLRGLPRPRLRWLIAAILTLWLMVGMFAGGGTQATQGASASPAESVGNSAPVTPTTSRPRSDTRVTTEDMPVASQKKTVQPITDAIVFTRRTGNRDFEIALLTPDGSSYRTVRTQRPSSDAVVSPDGKKIAFSQFGDFGWRLFVADADGLNPVQICMNRAGSYCRSPSWSPDGERIAFVCGRRLCLVNADGTGEKDIAILDEIRDPSFSPDGRLIVLVGRSGLDEDLYAMDLVTGRFQRLTSLEGGIGSPAWSPDGKEIVFTVYEKDYGRAPANLYVMSADGSGLRALTESTGAQNIQPSWSPDGKQIVFVSDRNHLAGDQEYPPYLRFQLYVMDIDGSNVRQLSGVDALAPQWVRSR